MSWTDWYTESIATLKEQLGASGAKGFDGQQLPAMNSIQAIAVLGQLSPAVIRAISRVSQDQNGQMLLSSNLDGSGLTAEGDLTFLRLQLQGAQRISAAEYVAGFVPDPGAPWKRSPDFSTDPSVPTYEPWLYNVEGAETQLLAFGRQLIADWQRAVEAGAALVQFSGVNVFSPCSDDSITAFWQTVRATCADLDVLSENPPPTEHEKIAAGMRQSYDTVSKFADEAANKIGETAGEVAAKLAKITGESVGAALTGFIQSASGLAFIVAGFAVWWHLHK